MRRRETFSTNPFKNALIIYALQLKCTETLKVKTYDSATNSSKSTVYSSLTCIYTIIGNSTTSKV